MNLIKIKRGSEAGIPTLAFGELGFTTDTKKLFIGNGVGNVLLAVATGIEITKSIDENYNANISELLLINSLTAAITITLPSDPENGNRIVLIDSGYNASVNNITVARNGNSINNYAEDLTVDVNGASILLIFDGVRSNWFVQT